MYIYVYIWYFHQLLLSRSKRPFLSVLMLFSVSTKEGEKKIIQYKRHVSYIYFENDFYSVWFMFSYVREETQGKPLYDTLK